LTVAAQVIEMRRIWHALVGDRVVCSVLAADEVEARQLARWRLSRRYDLYRRWIDAGQVVMMRSVWGPRVREVAEEYWNQ